MSGHSKAETDTRATDRRAFLRALGLDTDTLTPHIRAVLEALGEEVLSLRDALESAEALADNDTLCPVFNRRAFLRELRREIALAERFNTPLTLVFVDLDNFKEVNDRFGHATGDDVLLQVAGLLREQTRATDVIGRLGGDEFGIALAHADYDAGAAKALDLESRIDRLVVRQNGSTAVQLGASCGISSWQRGWSPEMLIAEADAAMFAAKSQRKRDASGRQDQKGP